MLVMQRKIIFSSLIAVIFLTAFLAGCTSNTATTSENNIPATSTISQTSAAPTFTPTPIPTETLTSTEIPYDALSNGEKIERSVTLVEKANNFSGEVVVPMNLNGKMYNFYWCPICMDKYDSGLRGAWKTEAQGFELDRTGETLPPIAVAGYETPDGLVAVDPITGEETFYPNQNIPAFGGVISYKDLLAIPQSELASTITDAALSDSDNPGVNDILVHIDDQSVYLPVLLWGEQTSVFAQGFGNGGGAGQDVPEQKYSVIEVATNNGLMPIYSPETGEFMLFRLSRN